MTTTPTSGAAIQRYKIGYHADEWGQRSSTPSGIPDASGSWVRYADHVNALASGQATAAQQGVAYAALPTSSYAGRVYEEGFLIGTRPLYTADQLHAFADATHTLRASHGQAPAGAGEAAEHYRNAIASACEGWTMPDGLRKHLEAALWSPPTPQPTQAQGWSRFRIYCCAEIRQAKRCG